MTPSVETHRKVPVNSRSAATTPSGSMSDFCRLTWPYTRSVSLVIETSMVWFTLASVTVKLAGLTTGVPVQRYESFSSPSLGATSLTVQVESSGMSSVAGETLPPVPNSTAKVPLEQTRLAWKVAPAASPPAPVTVLVTFTCADFAVMVLIAITETVSPLPMPKSIDSPVTALGEV